MTAADTFLLDALSRGPLPASEVLDAGRAAGITPRQLRRARERLGVEVTQAERRWHWRLTGDALSSVTPQERDGRQRQGPPPTVQVPQAPAGYVMEDRYAMTVARPRPKPKRQVPPGDVCTECGRMTCEACGAEIPAHRVRAHREGRDGARPQCPLQDVRAIAVERERPRSFANRLFGTVGA